MPKNSFLQAMFKGPKFSVAPIEQNNRGSLKIGKVVPVFSTILNPREGIQLDMGHLVRFMPAKAPVMEGYKVTFDAFAVPFSALGYAERKERDLDDFFNIKLNAGETENPYSVPMSELFGLTSDLSLRFYRGGLSENHSTTLNSLFAKGMLGDYMNFPSLKACKEHVRKWLSVNPLLYGNNISNRVTMPEGYDEFRPWAEFITLVYLNQVMSTSESAYFEIPLGTGSVSAYCETGCPFSVGETALIVPGDEVDVHTEFFYNDGGAFGTGPFECVILVPSLLRYILNNYPAVASYYNIGFDLSEASDGTLGSWLSYLELNRDSISLDYLKVLYDLYKIDAQSIYEEYFEYVIDSLFYRVDIINYEEKTLMDSAWLPVLSDDEPIDMSYFAAYWKIISDWYINTNIDGNPEDFFLDHCQLLTEDANSKHHLDLVPFNRRWANDIFTSSVPQSAVQNVRIPADGTIPDLREANAYQKLVDIFRNTGNRLRDVVYGIFGITPSAVRTEMAEPIGSKSTWIGMQSVLQTSETTMDSPQAAYAGIGTDSSGHTRILKYVNNGEPTPVIVMVLMSVTQRASYMQGFDRKFFRNSIYDFAIPELAMIGEQEVTSKELFFDKNAELGVFGFNRRYYDWFYSCSEVHGDLRESLDYWHGARYFDEQPELNSEFVGIDAELDHLQRVFANVSESAAPVIYNLSFDGYKTVALPRYIQYEL